MCRRRLVEWLKPLVEKLGHPAFVAVEMDPNIKAFLKIRRGMFERLAGGLWGDGVDPPVARALGETMAWEVDAHRAILDIEPVFLDEAGSREGAVEPKLHFGISTKRLEGFSGDRRSADEVAGYISEKSISVADAGAVNRYKNDPDFREQEAKREAGWIRVLRDELRKDGWGLAVVGAMHASQYDDRTFRNLLAAQRGVELAEVHYLGWTPPTNIA